MGIYKRPGSRLYWMSYTMKGEQYRESTKTSIHAAATKIWKQREAEVALQLFQVGWPGERITFDRLCDEYYDSHVKNLSDNSKAAFENSKRRLVNFFSGRMLTDISTDGIREYRDFRRQQPLKNRPDRTVKGATVNRELETLQGLFKLAVQRSYIQTDPTLNVEHFPEVRERPAKKRISYARVSPHPGEGPRLFAGWHSFARTDWQSNLQRAFHSPMGTGGSGCRRDQLQYAAQDCRIRHGPPVERFGCQGSSMVERTNPSGESIYFPKPKAFRPANSKCEEGLGQNSRGRRSWLLSDLSATARLLHSRE